MPGGTYKIRALSILSQSGVNAFSTDGVGGASFGFAPTNAELLTVINANTPAVPGESWFFGTIGDLVSGSILLIPDSDGIFLDGSLIPTAEADLPVGFTVDNGQIISSVDAALLAAVGADGTEQYYLRAGAALSTNKSNFFNIPNVPPLTLASILTLQYGCDWMTGDNIIPANSGALLAGPLYIAGTYAISGYSWNFGDTRILVRAGSLVKIESSGDPITGPDLTAITAITLSYDAGAHIIVIPVTAFRSVTPTLLTFDWPDTIPVAKVVSIIPTIFGGSVTLGTLTVSIANASGIYKLDTSLTHDKLYINSGSIPTTEPVRIPDPFFKTGFISG